MIKCTLSVLKFSFNSSPKDELGAGVLKAWVEGGGGGLRKPRFTREVSMKIPMSRHQLALSLTAALSPWKEFIQHSHLTPFLQYLKVRVQKGMGVQFRKVFKI